MVSIPTATVPGNRTVPKLSTTVKLLNSPGPVQQRLDLDPSDVSNSQRYIVLEGESERTLAQSAVTDAASHREGVLEGERTAKYFDDRVATELHTYQWKGTGRSLPVELQWPGYEPRPSTFFIVDSSCTRAELTVKIARWVLIQMETFRKTLNGTVPAWILKNLDEHRLHLIGLYGVEDARHEIYKYVVDLSMDIANPR